MAKVETFSVSKKNFPEFTVSRNLPENLDDPVWKDLVDDYPQDVHDLALRQFVVACQGNARNRLDEQVSQEVNAAAVQQAVTDYKYGARSGGFQRPTLKADAAKDLKFNKQQLELLRSLGVNVEAPAA